MKIKIGHGYDAHRFKNNEKLILGGVEIEYKHGLSGHSDADVLTHAVIDALLGAAGLDDIGVLFPDSDEKYKNISSLILLERTVNLIKKDYTISNIDCTVVAEEPKLTRYKQAMKSKLSGVPGLDGVDINVKATTEEGMGFTGRREGIAAYAVCILMQKNKNQKN